MTGQLIALVISSPKSAGKLVAKIIKLVPFYVTIKNVTLITSLIYCSNTHFQCMRGNDIWRQVDQLKFRIGDELTSPFWRRDDRGDELTCNRG